MAVLILTKISSQVGMEAFLSAELKSNIAKVYLCPCRQTVLRQFSENIVGGFLLVR